MKTPITLLDVATAANVSKSTVANVFNRPDRVRPELRARIEAVARDLGYAGPDPKGRLLSSGKVNAIGLVPPADTGFAWVHADPYMHDLLTGVSEVCDEQHVGLLLIAARDDQGRSGVPNAVVDGMIVSTAAQASLIEPGLRRRLRFVVLDADGGADMSSIRFDNHDGARRLVRHLVGLGHRRIGIITVSRVVGAPILHLPGQGPPGLAAAYDEEWENYDGVAEALAEAGLSIADMPLIEACGSADELRDFGDPCELLLDHAADVTAVVSFHGSLTPRLLAAVHRRGLAVPQAISVAGILDDGALATELHLTAIIRPISIREKGRRAAEMLFAPGPAQQLLLPVELVVGASTGPARA